MYKRFWIRVLLLFCKVIAKSLGAFFVVWVLLGETRGTHNPNLNITFTNTCTWVFHYECMECMECNLNREGQPGTFPVWCHFAASFCLKRVGICSSFISLKLENCLLFETNRGFCLCTVHWLFSLIPALGSTTYIGKQGSAARALFLLGVGFYTYKIILLYHNRDMVTFLPLLLHRLKRSFTFFRRACVQNFTPAVSLSGASVCLWNIGTVLPLRSPWNKWTAWQQALLKTQSYHGEITANAL